MKRLSQLIASITNGFKPGEEVVVYTAILDGHDELAPAHRLPEVRFVCFTDGSTPRTEGWNFIKIPRTRDNPRRVSRWFKVHPHRLFPDHIWSIWCDGTHRLNCDPSPLVLQASRGFAAYSHRHRDCVYDEALVCIDRGFPEDVIRAQMRRYRDEGFPAHYGLFENGVLVRRHRQEEVISVMEDWWDEIERGSVRDQLSLPYVLWKRDFHINKLTGGNAVENEFFTFTPHDVRSTATRFRPLTPSSMKDIRKLEIMARLFFYYRGDRYWARRAYWDFLQKDRLD